MVLKEITYPIFFECCQFTEDNFWRNIFEDLAYSKTPYGTYINNDYLLCGYKDKDFSYKIKGKNSKQLYTDIYDLLKNRLGILSGKEKTRKRLAYFQAENRIKNSRKNWNNIRKKNIKDILVERYVVEMKQRYNLPSKQAKILMSIIFIALAFKILVTTDIHYQDGKITDIDNIIISKKTATMKKNIYSLNVPFTRNITNAKKTMSSNWDNYLKPFRKKK